MLKLQGQLSAYQFRYFLYQLDSKEAEIYNYYTCIIIVTCSLLCDRDLSSNSRTPNPPLIFLPIKDQHTIGTLAF